MGPNCQKWVRFSEMRQAWTRNGSGKYSEMGQEWTRNRSIFSEMDSDYQKWDWINRNGSGMDQKSETSQYLQKWVMQTCI